MKIDVHMEILKEIFLILDICIDSETTGILQSSQRDYERGGLG